MKGFNWNKIDTSLKIYALIKEYANKHNYNILWSECFLQNGKECAYLAFLQKSDYKFNEYNWEEGFNWFPNKYITLSKTEKLIF